VPGIVVKYVEAQAEEELLRAEKRASVQLNETTNADIDMDDQSSSSQSIVGNFCPH
jgi:hypothetical protein